MNRSMPAPRARRLLWLALVLALPLPFFALAIGIAPPVRMLFVGSLVLGFFLSAPSMMTGLFLGIFMGQGMFWLAATRWLAKLGVRLLGSGAEVDARRIYAIVGALFVVSLLPIYQLPFSSGEQPTNLFGLFR